MKPIIAEHDSERTTLRTYITGFVSSVVLTVAAYVMVVDNAFSKWTLAIVVALLALIQFMVQLVFFLHLGQDTKPRFKVGVFLFMLLVLLIIVVGSLWIMHSLNYRMDMSPTHIQDYMNSQIGL